MALTADDILGHAALERAVRQLAQSPRPVSHLGLASEYHKAQANKLAVIDAACEACFMARS